MLWTVAVGILGATVMPQFVRGLSPRHTRFSSGPHLEEDNLSSSGSSKDAFEEFSIPTSFSVSAQRNASPVSFCKPPASA